MQIVGRYKYVSSENFEEYMKALGHLEAATVFLKTVPVVEIKEDGDNWIIAVENGGKVVTTTFKLGEPYDEKLPSYEATLKSVTTKDGNKFRTESQVPDTATQQGVKSIRVYEFTEDGMIVHLSDTKTGVKATRTYKRI